MIEGPRLLEEALAANGAIEAVFLAAGWDRVASPPGGALQPEGGGKAEVGPELRLVGLVDRCYSVGARVFELAPGVLERVAGTVSPQPLMAICALPPASLERFSSDGPQLVVVCADVRDPGNAGTLVRSAWAAGASGVVCCEGTVDMWNPKAVRSSAGAVFYLPVVAGGAVEAVLDELGEWGLERWGAVASGGTNYDELDLTHPCALVVGNESAGLPVAALAGHLDGLVSIPMPGGAESLNVGAAASVLCFEAARQRRRVGIVLRRSPVAGKLAAS